MQDKPSIYVDVSGYSILIDEEDIPLIQQHNWWVNNTEGKIRVMRMNHPHKNNITLHRELMGVTDPKVQVDHKNRNRLDNRKSNLRPCTNAENARNSTRPVGESGYRGVRLRKRPGVPKYQVYLTVDGKGVSGGTFTDPILAAIKYNELATKYHGDFATLNIIDPSKVGTVTND